MSNASRYALAAGVATCCFFGVTGVSLADVYTLDGQATSKTQAIAGSLGGGCAASASSEGVIACFSTENERDQAVVRDLQANRIPPGFAGMPTDEQRAKLLNSTHAASHKQGKHKKHKKGHRKAHAASCGQATHIHNDYYQQGTYGYFYTTNGWINFSDTFNDKISSDTTSTNYHAFYHQLKGGAGHYYDGARNYCHVDNSLAFDAFPEGGTWDNRFSSYNSY